MPLPFEDFQGKGVLDLHIDFSSSTSNSCLIQQGGGSQQDQHAKVDSCYVGSSEPTSLLESTTRSPSPSSTLSSSHGGAGGGASTDTTTTTGNLLPASSSSAAAAVNVSVDPNTSDNKCGQGIEDWETVLSGSPSQDQSSIMRLIMGDDVDDSSINKLWLNNESGSHQDLDFSGGFGGVVDQGFGFELPITEPSLNVASDFSRVGPVLNHNSNPNFLPPGVFHHQPQQQQQQQQVPEIVFNQSRPQQQMFNQLVSNSGSVLPLSYPQFQEQHHLLQPPAKRPNLGFDPSARPELYLHQTHQQQPISMLQTQQRPAAVKRMNVSDELANQQLQQAIVNPICQAAELIETGNPVIAQGILARLNHQLPLPIGKPYQRAAFYFKEALQLLLRVNNIHNFSFNVLPCNLIFKIGAYKSFSEISPVLQFANFTCNQALLEAFEGSDRIHVIDFDIGYGSQWASLMQELASRGGAIPTLKITAVASPSTHTDIELGFTHDNLRNFARDINIPFEFEILGLESLNAGSWPILHASEKETVGVNLPIWAFSSYPASLQLAIRFVKQLSPKILVSLDRGCDRTDFPFALQVNHAIQCYSTLLESLDTANTNLDTLGKIERFVIQPGIEKMVLGRHRCPDRTLHLKSLFLQAGFTPLAFSNFAEAQAECLLQRTLVRGFHVDRRQSSLVLGWQRKDLISASAWRCVK